MEKQAIDTAVKIVTELLGFKAAHPSHHQTYERHPWVWDHDLTRFTEFFFPFVPESEREDFKRRVLQDVQRQISCPR